MKITILGTASAPLPRKSKRGGTSVLVSFSGGKVLFDCGPGVSQSIIDSGTDLWEIDSLFLTHHHYDHTSDLGLFVMGRWEWSLFHSMEGHELAPQLEICGPARTEHMVHLLFGEDGFYSNDIASRIRGEGERLYAKFGLKPPIAPPRPTVRDIRPGEILETAGFRITVAEGEHCQPYLVPLAYRIDTREGSVVFSGDTGECHRIKDLALGADLLIHDCSQTEERRLQIGYHKLHSSPVVAGRIGATAKVKKLVAFHFGLKSEPPEVLGTFQDQIQQHFGGEVLVANDLDSIEI